MGMNKLYTGVGVVVTGDGIASADLFGVFWLPKTLKETE